MVPIEISSPHSFLFDLYTHYTLSLHRLAAIHNAPDIQTDRVTAIGRLRYSIGGLKTYKENI